ncbi:MAG: hypothetical protein M3Y05_07360 [Gemmatimonadota bacterium]|nr:hypothetical protein [Gemmatimonadota bacterium]
MGTSVGNARFGSIFFTIEDGGIFFEVEDARLEITRDVNSQGRRTGTSLDVRVHIVIDLLGTAGNNLVPKLFAISIQADDIVQKFKLQWTNPLSQAVTIVRELSFSGWCAGFELYRPVLTGSAEFGTSEGSANTRLGRADQLLHCTFAIVTDDDNIGDFTITE